MKTKKLKLAPGLREQLKSVSPNYAKGLAIDVKELEAYLMDIFKGEWKDKKGRTYVPDGPVGDGWYSIGGGVALTRAGGWKYYTDQIKELSKSYLNERDEIHRR